MKVEIEISDFYFEESEFTDALKAHTIRDAVSTVKKETDKYIQDEVSRQVKELVLSSLNKRIEIETKRILKEGLIKSYDSNIKEPVSFETYIQQMFNHNGNYNSINEVIKRVANDFAEQARKKYDLMFASQVVNSMRENGFLNEEGAKLLLK